MPGQDPYISLEVFIVIFRQLAAVQVVLSARSWISQTQRQLLALLELALTNSGSRPKPRSDVR